MINDKIIIEKFAIIHRVPKSCKIHMLQKGCVKHIHLVTDDGLYDWKAFSTKILFFIHPL